MAGDADRAYQVLKQQLLSGYYAPGTQLKEEALAAQLHVSRTPVRSALKRLLADGLAVSSQGRGVRVAAWTQRDIEEIFQLRLLLEPYAAQLATECRPDGLLAQLHACNQDMARAIAAGGDSMVPQVQSANSRFHHALLDASGSSRLRQILATMIDMPIITRSFYLRSRDDLAQSLRHHQDLTIAVEAGDGGLAHQVMQLHLRMTRHQFMRARAAYAKTLGTDQSTS